MKLYFLKPFSFIILSASFFHLSAMIADTAAALNKKQRSQTASGRMTIGSFKKLVVQSLTKDESEWYEDFSQLMEELAAQTDVLKLEEASKALLDKVTFFTSSTGNAFIVLLQGLFQKRKAFLEQPGIVKTKAFYCQLIEKFAPGQPLPSFASSKRSSLNEPVPVAKAKPEVEGRRSAEMEESDQSNSQDKEVAKRTKALEAQLKQGQDETAKAKQLWQLAEEEGRKLRQELDAAREQLREQAKVERGKKDQVYVSLAEAYRVCLFTGSSFFKAFAEYKQAQMIRTFAQQGWRAEMSIGPLLVKSKSPIGPNEREKVLEDVFLSERKAVSALASALEESKRDTQTLVDLSKSRQQYRQQKKLNQNPTLDESFDYQEEEVCRAQKTIIEQTKLMLAAQRELFASYREHLGIGKKK